MFKSNDDENVYDTDEDNNDLNNKSVSSENSIENFNRFENFKKFDDFDEDELMNEKNFEDDFNDNNFNDNIHIYKQIRNARKCQTIINGLTFKNPQDEKEFLSKVTKKFGIGGCKKKVEEINSHNLVYVFMGDYRDKIKQFLIKEYNKEDSCISIHG